MTVRVPSPDSIELPLAERIMLRSGFNFESFPRGCGQVGTAPATQALTGSMVSARSGEYCNNISVIVTVVGAILTLVKVGLYDLDGTLLGSSIDVHAGSGVTDFTATGLKVVPLQVPIPIAADREFYATILQVGTTPATLLRSFNVAVAGTLAGIGDGYAQAVVQTGQADLPAPATFSAASILTWFGGS